MGCGRQLSPMRRMQHNLATPPTGSQGALGFECPLSIDSEDDEARELLEEREFYGNAGGEFDILDPTDLCLGYQPCAEFPGKVGVCACVRSCCKLRTSWIRSRPGLR